MKKLSILIITLTMVLVFASAAWGVSFGARAAGMGGAFTAVADDCSAVYWNPAGITQLKVLTITPGAGILGNEDQIRSSLEMVNDPNLDSFFELLGSLDKDGLAIGGSAYLGVTTKFFAVNLFADANMMIKQEEILNKSHFELNQYGIGTLAIPFGPWALGANLKLVRSGYGKSTLPIVSQYDYDYLIANWPTLAALFTQENTNAVEATGEGVALDVGALFSLTNLLKVGLSCRNIASSVEWSGTQTPYVFNNDPVTPAFVPDTANTKPFTKNEPLPSTWTLGVALRPTGSTLIAADIESITNPIDPSFSVTLYHVGLEQLLFLKTLALRLGAFTTPTEELGYALGAGFKLGPVLIDVALNQVGETQGAYLTAGFIF